jgi:adenylylsulfate kinase-like enzyme
VRHVTGVDSPYERPDHPDIRVETTTESAETLADHIVRNLIERGLIERK